MLNKKALAATAAGEKIYVEDVFNTYLYNGTGSYTGFNIGIPNLAEEGAMFWFKNRSGSPADTDHKIYDTERASFGAGFLLSYPTIVTNSASINNSGSSVYIVNNSTTGYIEIPGSGGPNENNTPYALWAFRKAKKFFDIVTWTGDGTSSRNISHNLGSTIGFIAIKRTDTTGNWIVSHRSLSSYGLLNASSAFNASLNFGSPAANGYCDLSTSSSTQFNIKTGNNSLDDVNASGGSYVAYIFAHNAGGFGDSGSESVISCGSFTHTNGTATNISLGWEPQWILMKRSDSTGNWLMMDSIRGMPVNIADTYLVANSTASEASTTLVEPSATGFLGNSSLNSGTYIYIAIRRGPMKTPEAGTSVYTSGLSAGTTTSPAFTSNFVVDLAIKKVPSSSNDATLGSRLQGARVMYTTASSAEEASTAYKYDFNNGFGYGYSTSTRAWLFRRAPKFMDVVCFTGDGTTNKSISHNLGATPNLIIAKSRSTSDWLVYTSSPSYELVLNTSDAEKGQVYDFYPSVNSSTVFGVAPSAYSGAANINVSGITYVAYLFATLAGVSKVGSYTGTGTTKQIDCGFTAGARFVMIKRADSTGDWYVWDSSRGIVAGNDPYMLLNLPDPDVTNTDYIDTYSQGFEISSTAPAAINANGGTFIFLAIA